MSMNDEGPGGAPYDGEVITRGADAPAALPVSRGGNPFGNAPDERTNAGAVAIESQRATAEVQGRLVLAKRFPRDAMAAYAMAMQACGRKGLAEQALYAYPKGGKSVTGPSIRLAEELVRCWSNVDYGINELSRQTGTPSTPGSSEMEAYAWDLETNTRSSQRFTVAHIRDKTDGGARVTSERDIYELTANMGSRRVRARILAILPPELVDDAVYACSETMKNGDASMPFPDRVRGLMVNLSRAGVSPKMVTDLLGHPADEMTRDEYVTVRAIFQSLKDGSKVSEFFGAKADAGGSRLDTLEKSTAKKPEPEKVAETSGKPASEAETGNHAAEREDGPRKAALALIARFVACKNSDQLQAILNEKATVRDRAYYDEQRPELAAQITKAMDTAAARLAGG